MNSKRARFIRKTIAGISGQEINRETRTTSRKLVSQTRSRVEANSSRRLYQRLKKLWKKAPNKKRSRVEKRAGRLGVWTK